MDQGIKISDSDVVNLDHIAPDVSGVRVLFVNVYAVRGPEGWVLIDGGLPLSASRIRHWAQKHFGEKVKPAAILLTHGHFDHTGAVKDLSKEWDVTVYAHPLELPYLQGKKSYPPPNAGAGGGAMSLMAPLYPKGPIDLGGRVQPLPADGTVPFLADWKWLATPGHTDGHVSFFRASDRTLIAGDAFATTQSESVTATATQARELHGPPAFYTSDWDAAKTSVETLAALSPVTVAAGHGTPLSGPDISAALRKLATDFDRIARPDNQRKNKENKEGRRAA